jgi:YegS/Rv2252/BmrU family lipid kinase
VANKVKVVLNSYGGRLSTQAKRDRVEQGLQAAGVDYHLELTTEAGHGIELAHQAALDGWPIVVAAGGDGTIHEVVNGLMQAAGEAEAGTLGIIPLGTANDLADALEIPRNINRACQRLAAGKTRLIDIGQVNDRYFANNSAVGLEPAISLAHDRMRWIKGNIRYILAALKSIMTARCWTMRLTWHNGIYEGPVIIVSVGNSCRTGGEFYMCPDASLDDGLIDFVYGVGMSRWQMLRLLPQTFTGSHVNHRLVVYRQTTTLSITASPPTAIQADGEIIETNATEINYRVLPKKLRVIV